MSEVAGLKSHVGTKSREYHLELSEAAMRSFADCVRATRGNTHHSQISSMVAPTLFTLCREGEFELLQAWGIELKQVLHAEQEYEMFAPWGPGEPVIYRTTLVSCTEKRSRDSAMAFLVFETPIFRSADATVLARARSTILFRDQRKAEATA